MRAGDRDQFIPGLKPRGHEDVLYATVRELLASLPAPADQPAGPGPGDGADLFDAAGDREEALSYLRRHGHRRLR